MTDCTFANNLARTAGGAVYNRERSHPSFINCSFIDNSANDSGGAIYNRDNCNPILQNCTIVANNAAFDGGGVCNTDDCEPQIFDSILWDNSDDGGTDESAQVYGGTPFFRNSCIQGWTATLPSEATIGDDPLFVSGPKGDYYLSHQDTGQSQTSPCVNSGSMQIDEADVAGSTTRTDNVIDTEQLDMGRHYSIQHFADIAGDPKVNLADFAKIAVYWNTTNCGRCGGADFAGNDQTVDFDDIVVFADNWLQQ